MTNPGDFEYVRQLVRQHASNVLEPDKAYLVQTRLSPIARREGLASVEDLVLRLRGRPFDGLHQSVVEAMMNHETTFFRDFGVFECLRTHVLPDFFSRRATARKLYIWSAACSTGQEPYSLAMMIREYFPALLSWDLRILATDLSGEVLTRAKAGLYNQVEVNRGLPAAFLVKYFRRVEAHWEIREDVRRMVEFQKMNLAEPWPPMPDMDFIFLRNVLIYFEMTTRKEILTRVRKLMKPDGLLFLGSAETTLTIDDMFDLVKIDRTVAYRPKGR